MARGPVKKRASVGPASSVMPPPTSLRSFPGSASFSSSSRRHLFFRRRFFPFFLLFLSIFIPAGFYFFVSRRAPPPGELYTFEIVNEYPHDPRAFTQGLVYGGDDLLYESTGIYGQSTVRQVHLSSGKVVSSHKMDSAYFGEGLTLLGDRLFQVTWLKNTGFIYGRGNLSKLGVFTHQMKDGWGLATDGKILFGSDGTSIIYQIDPESLKVIKETTVRYKDSDISRLNELEYVNGEVWANVWMSDCIARISPQDGRVLGWILLRSLREKLLLSGERNIDCLNGIAWDEGKNRLFVTGKLWPKLYEIRLQPFKGNLERSIESMCFSPYS